MVLWMACDMRVQVLRQSLLEEEAMSTGGLTGESSEMDNNLQLSMKSAK